MNEETTLVAKPVRDMYGTSMGVVLGTITDIDGSIQTVAIDCGSAGLQQVPYEQLVVQNDVVVFVPKWRLDSQRLLRQKGLAVRRLSALMDIVSENDEMREDAETIHEKYKAKLISLDAFEREIVTALENRKEELDVQMRSAKTVRLYAKIQCKSSDIDDQTYDQVRRQSDEIIERITHESSEISNAQKRIADLGLEISQTFVEAEEPEPVPVAQDVRTSLPEAPSSPVETEPKPEQDWLARMAAQ